MTRQLVRALESRVAPPGPFVVVWRWRYEAALLIGGPLFVSLAGWQIVVTVAGLLVALVSVSPFARRYALARLWCVVIPHRIRAACAEALVVTRRGRLPIVLWTRPSREGERVWVYCRAGITEADFADTASLIASACWAREVRVTKSPRHPAVIRVDVIR
ncbi:hypothetical protein FDA94_06020 [Herbidospora galbida]|uniref:Uncharacterized protein n=1 Tax=Herbidospora galbida TaxID=2575442 RepID=A0A4U3MQZ9_9ACTN|nr:hypothetical protein [Herbidospora galbida]TKK90546.1 hypothetical protein FDA94_06020 [Herbidospora galbida]